MALTVEDAVPYRRINLQIIVKYQEMGYVAKVVTDAGTVTADVFSECEEFVLLPFGGGDDNASLDLLKRLANDMKETDRKPIVHLLLQSPTALWMLQTMAHACRRDGSDKIFLTQENFGLNSFCFRKNYAPILLKI